LPFHVSGESYGGHYLPEIGREIHDQNKALAISSSLISTERVHIPLASLLIGNGLTEPLTQFASVYDYACDRKEPIFDEATCTSIKGKSPTCARLQKVHVLPSKACILD